MSRMRLCLVSPGYPPHNHTGIATAVSCVAEPLVRRGHEVHVVTWEPSDGPADHDVEGVHVHRRSLRYVPGVRRLLSSSSIPARLLARLPQQSLTRPGRRLGAAVTAWSAVRDLGGFDLVEVPDSMGSGLLLGVGSRPVVATTYGPLLIEARYCGFPAHAYLRAAIALERIAVERADAVITCSGTLAEELRDAGWRGATDAHIIPNAIDLRSWRPRRDATTRRRLVIAGHVTPRKGLDVLLRALAQLRGAFDDAEVAVVGAMGAGWVDGRQYSDEIDRLVRECGSRVEFLDHLPRTQLQALYAGARAVVVPSRFDNCPMTALEGMAMARPIVTTTRAGLGTVSGDGVTVVPPGDPSALADSLAPLLANADLADEVGRAARLRVEREHDPDDIAARRETVYEQVIANARRGRTRPRRTDPRPRTT